MDIEDLKRKEQQYRDVALRCERDAVANYGAADAIHQLIVEQERDSAVKKQEV